ncbi:MAG: dephospho-CoA kinase [Bacteroidaceae bacterium]|nr:dephospho-CoA kinase [Bacteroidaceae bacterium]
MKVIGVTGGIGCGKSYVSAKMQLRGIPVYDSDSRAKLLTATDPLIKEALTELVGPTLYCPCGCGVMQKEVLAQFIFGNPENMAKVNAIIHPRVREDFEHWTAGLIGKDFCILESAILFESGFDKEVDYTVCVDAPLPLRIKRCVKRDNTTEQAVVVRINSQMDQAEKCRLADFVIVNDDVRDLAPQIDALLDNVRKL